MLKKSRRELWEKQKRKKGLRRREEGHYAGLVRDGGDVPTDRQGPRESRAVWGYQELLLGNPPHSQGCVREGRDELNIRRCRDEATPSQEMPHIPTGCARMLLASKRYHPGEFILKEILISVSGEKLQHRFHQMLGSRRAVTGNGRDYKRHF